MLGKFIIIYSIIQTFLMPVIFRSTDIPYFASMVVHHEEKCDYVSAELKNFISKELRKIIENGILIEISYEVRQVRKVKKKKKEVIESKVVIKGLSYNTVGKKYQVISGGKKEEFLNFKEGEESWGKLIRIPFLLEGINKGEKYSYQVIAKLGKIKSVSNLEVDLMSYWAKQIPLIESKVIER